MNLSERSNMNIDLRDNTPKTCVDLMIQENPNLNSLILSYPEDQLEKIIANKDKLNKVMKCFENVSRGGTISAIIMVCNTSTCPYKEICVLLKNDLAPTGGSCLPGHTEILMEDGNRKQISSIKKGDKIVNINENIKKITIDTVKNAINNGIKDIYEIKTLFGHEVQCTVDHPFYSLNGSIHYRKNPTKKGKCVLPEDLPHVWKSISDGLKVSDRIAILKKESKSKDAIQLANQRNKTLSRIEGDILWDHITSIKKIGTDTVYDLTIETNKNFVANGIIVHNCPIERKMVMELESDISTSLGIDANDPIEMELLWDLIDTKILDLRASALLRNGEMSNVIKTIAGKIESTKIEIKPELTAKFALKEIKHSIIDAFVATRRAKKKYGMNVGSNALEDLLKKAVSGSKKEVIEDV